MGGGGVYYTNLSHKNFHGQSILGEKLVWVVGGGFLKASSVLDLVQNYGLGFGF